MTILEKVKAHGGPWETILTTLGIDPNAEWVEPRRWNNGERLLRGYYIYPGDDNCRPHLWRALNDNSSAVGEEFGPYLNESAAAQAMTRGDHLPKPAAPKDLRPLLDEARAMIERLSAAMQEPQP